MTEHEKFIQASLQMVKESIGFNLPTGDEAAKHINERLKKYGLHIDFSNMFSPVLEKYEGGD